MRKISSPGRIITALSCLIVGVIMATPGALAESDTQTYGDWSVRCLELEKALPCDMVQTIIDKPSGKQVLAFSIAWSPKDDRHAMQIVVPLGIRLEPGLAIRIGEDFSAQGIRVTRCEPAGCFVEAMMAPDLLAAMKSGEEGQLVMMDAAANLGALPFSLKGFTAAHKVLQKETGARVAE